MGGKVKQNSERSKQTNSKLLTNGLILDLVQTFSLKKCWVKPGFVSS